LMRCQAGSTVSPCRRAINRTITLRQVTARLDVGLSNFVAYKNVLARASSAHLAESRREPKPCRREREGGPLWAKSGRKKVNNSKSGVGSALPRTIASTVKRLHTAARWSVELEAAATLPETSELRPM
jgi:hypothetical protein